MTDNTDDKEKARRIVAEHGSPEAAIEAISGMRPEAVLLDWVMKNVFGHLPQSERREALSSALAEHSWNMMMERGMSPSDICDCPNCTGAVDDDALLKDFLNRH